MLTLSDNLIALRQRIAAAAQAAGRNPADVTLIGVCKTRPAEDVTEARRLGLAEFGENYLDEALPKLDAVPDAVWHYIGRVQSNKTRLLAQRFQWVHTVDRDKIARRLDSHCAPERPLNVLIQVNADDDPDKGGLPPGQVAQLAGYITTLPNLRLRGLMTILSRETNPGAGYQSVAQLAAGIAAGLPQAQRDRWDTLSMGMSGDLEAAIAAGATHIRIGTALFGERTAQHDT